MIKSTVNSSITLRSSGSMGYVPKKRNSLIKNDVAKVIIYNVQADCTDLKVKICNWDKLGRPHAIWTTFSCREGISHGAHTDGERPFASAWSENASGFCSSGATHSDRAIRSDANLTQICVSVDAARTRKVSARVWQTFRRARLAVTQRRCVFSASTGSEASLWQSAAA
jgi:hypothetical protein